MKKKWTDGISSAWLRMVFLMVIAAAAVFSSCGTAGTGTSADASSGAAAETQGADSQEDDGEAQETEALLLSDLFVRADEISSDENLYVYTGDALEYLSYPEYILCEEGLLFYDTDYSESEENYVTLALFDPQSGTLTTQTKLQSEFITDIRRTDLGILLCDSSIGYAMLLDEDLEQIRKWDIEPNYEYWYAGTDGSCIYKIEDGALCRIALTDEASDSIADTAFSDDDADPDGSAASSADASEVLLTSDVSLYGSQSLNGGAQICYVDASQMTVLMWLDLDDGSLTSPSFEVSADTLTRTGDTWLVRLTSTSSAYEYVLGSEEEAYYAALEEGSLMQICGSDCLLYEDSAENTFILYDASGTYLDSIAMDAEDLWYYGNYCVYMEAYSGFFLLLYTDDGPRLYFWDAFGEAERISQENADTGETQSILQDSSDTGETQETSDSAGEETESGGSTADLTLVPLEEYSAVPEGTAVDEALYERAAEIGETYGVEIRIADQCETVYTDFTAVQVTDESLIAAGLDLLEEALSQYPDGFLAQLKYDTVTGLQINLCGTLTPTNENWGEEGYNAVTEESGSRNVMVYDLNQMYTDTVWHEVSHVIDKKLAWDAYCREEALFSEDGWAALNPDGFEYTYVYSGFTDLTFEDDEWMYFIDTYSMVSPTEDRARIMEYAMAGYDEFFTDFEPTMEKLLYYCECIRDAFDTEGWPQVTAWETVTE